MNDEDFLENLSADQRATFKEAQTFFKQSAPAIANMAIDFARTHATQIGAALAGAATITGVQYAANRAGKSGQSVQQKSFQLLADAAERSIADRADMGKPMTFKQDLAKSTADGLKGISDTLARHPGKGALLAAPIGASAAWRIAKALT